jgi:Domain of unknown function (DUF4190)
VSDMSQGPGWWLASDGKWYSPDQVPGYAAPTGPTSGPPPVATYGPPPFAAYPSPGTPLGYGSPVGEAGYGYAGGGMPYGLVPMQKTNGLAIAAMVCSFFFWLWGVGAILGIVLGFVARSQIKRSGGTQQGKGMALAGIIIGFAGIVIGVVLVIVLIAVVHHCQQNDTCTTTTFNSGT